MQTEEYPGTIPVATDKKTEIIEEVKKSEEEVLISIDDFLNELEPMDKATRYYYRNNFGTAELLSAKEWSLKIGLK